MFALITNDDGIQADGIQTLIRVASRVFDKIVVVAPRSQKSAVSQAITINRSFRVFERYGDDMYGLEATPTDCVFFGLRELVDRKPDFLLSGINLGPNLGYDTLYSGTVGAAREGLMNGIPSLAFSLAVTRPVDFEQAEEHIETVLRVAVKRGIPEGTMLNVNIPSREMFGPVKGFRVCGLGTRVFANKTAVWEDPNGMKHGWIGGREFSLQGDDDSDCRWMARGYATLTPLTWNLARNAGGDMTGWKEELDIP